MGQIKGFSHYLIYISFNYKNYLPTTEMSLICPNGLSQCQCMGKKKWRVRYNAESQKGQVKEVLEEFSISIKDVVVSARLGINRVKDMWLGKMDLRKSEMRKIFNYAKRLRLKRIRNNPLDT